MLEYRLQYINHTSHEPVETIIVTNDDKERPGQLQSAKKEVSAIGTTTTTAAVLKGIVHFTSRAESHKGYCHGGSMCSIMDDIIGWTGFCASGRCLPWSGYTVQVNTKLMKPVPVGRVLLLECRIVRLERRKVFVVAKLTDPAEEGDGGFDATIHAEADGLVILNRGVLPGL